MLLNNAYIWKNSTLCLDTMYMEKETQVVSTLNMSSDYGVET